MRLFRNTGLAKPDQRGCKVEPPPVRIVPTGPPDPAGFGRPPYLLQPAL